MKKFLNDLQKELKKLKISNQEIEEILNDHKEMIEEALNQGVTEEELELKFGEPSKLAQEMYKDSQKVRVDINEYSKESQYDSIEGYTLFKSLPVIDLNEIHIKLVSEDIELYPFEGQSVEVFYKNKIIEKNYEVTLENGVFKLLRNSKKTSLFEKQISPDFVVRYPNNGELSIYDIVTVSGDSEIKGIEAKTIKLKSTSGDFEVQGMKYKAAELTTVSGDFKLLLGNGGDLKMSSVSGDCDCKDLHVTGNLEINTVSGDFEFSNTTATQTDFTTVSGDLEGNEFYMETINLKSVSGDVEINNLDKLRPITIGKKRTLSGDVHIK